MLHSELGRFCTFLALLTFAGCACPHKETSSQPAPAAKVFDIRKFGARGDGKTLDTKALQAAFDACGEAGGGTVTIPPGTYLSQPLFMRNKTTLQIDKRATLLATDNRDDFLNPAKTNGPVTSGSFLAFINGKDLSDISITGKGAIDGAGAKWWVPAEEARRKVPGYTLPRPKMVVLTGCKRVRVTDVTLQNAPCFNLVPWDCEDVLIDGITILAPSNSPNTDGIDPSVSRNVTITHCRIDVGDDNVAIKSGARMPGREFACENITVTDCVFLHGHGMSIGSDTSGGVRNVRVERCTFQDTENGIRIKSPRGRGGRVENLYYGDITMKNVDPAITITCYYPKIPAQDEAQPVTDQTPSFRDITIKNVVATSPKSAGVIVGLPESLITNVLLENVQISSTTGLTVRNAKAVKLKHVRVNPKKGEALLTDNALLEHL